MYTRDNIELQVGNSRIRDFVSYSVDADMYEAASTWQVELSAAESSIRTGMECTLSVAGVRILTGVVDRVQKQRSKSSGTQITITGRDLMGLLVDAYCEQFISLEDMSIRGIAETLLRNIPMISRKNVEYRNKADRMSPKRAIQIEPGQTVFDVLREVAESRGLLFFCKPDGSLVFSRPAVSGAAEFNLDYGDGRNASRIISSNYVEDLAQRYSIVKIVTQQQGYEDIDAADISIVATATDNTVPFRKVFVSSVNEDESAPQQIARQTIEQQRWRGRELTYTVGGHEQNGKVWTIDKFCSVRDRDWNLRETMLISGRTLRMSRDEGSVTDVRLCIPGVAG